MLIETYAYIKLLDVYVDVLNDCIYAKKIHSIQDLKKNTNYLNAEEVTNILNEFLNSKNSNDIKTFIEKYGVIQGVECLSDIEKRSLKSPIREGYNVIGRLSEYNIIKKNMNDIRINISKLKLLSDFLKGNFNYADDDKIHILEDFIGERIDITSPEQCMFLEDYLDVALYDNINRHLEEINVCVVRDKDGNFFQTYEYPSLSSIFYAKLAEEMASNKIPQRCSCCGKWMTYRTGKKYCSNCTKTKRKEKFQEKADKTKEKIYAAVRDHFFTKCTRKCSIGYGINLNIYDCYKKFDNNAKRLQYFYECWREDALKIKKSSINFCNDLDDLCRKACSCKKCQAGLATYFKDKIEKKLHSD